MTELRGTPSGANLLKLDLDVLIAATDKAILALFAEWEEPITANMYDQIRYHMGYGDPTARLGKRMRPLLGLLTYASLSSDWERAIPGAAAVELGHNFSLVHDDIEDSDAERRGRPTLWVREGIPHAINTGDALFTISRVATHRLSALGFSDAKVIRMMKIYDETCLRLCGQFIDIAASQKNEMQSVEHYFEMIGRKTAALISGGVESAAVLATDDNEVIARFRSFGWALGLAFQINDDLLGIWGAKRQQGRSRQIWRDIRRRSPSSTQQSTPTLKIGRHSTDSSPRRTLTRHSLRLDSASLSALALRPTRGSRRRSGVSAPLQRYTASRRSTRERLSD